MYINVPFHSVCSIAAAGIEFPKLQPAAFDGVRGLAARNDIPADEIIVSVPRQIALTLPPKQRCPCPVSTAHVCRPTSLHTSLNCVPECNAPSMTAAGTVRHAAFNADGAGV